DVTSTRRGTSGPHTNVLEQTTQARGRKQPIDRLSLRRFGHLARRSRRPRNSRFGLVYSSPMTGNRPEITGSHRGFEIANAIGAQRKPTITGPITTQRVVIRWSPWVSCRECDVAARAGGVAMMMSLTSV